MVGPNDLRLTLDRMRFPGGDTIDVTGLKHAAEIIRAPALHEFHTDDATVEFGWSLLRTGRSGLSLQAMPYDHVAFRVATSHAYGGDGWHCFALFERLRYNTSELYSRENLSKPAHVPETMVGFEFVGIYAESDTRRVITAGDTRCSVRLDEDKPENVWWPASPNDDGNILELSAYWASLDFAAFLCAYDTRGVTEETVLRGPSPGAFAKSGPNISRSVRVSLTRKAMKRYRKANVRDETTFAVAEHYVGRHWGKIPRYRGPVGAKAWTMERILIEPHLRGAAYLREAEPRPYIVTKDDT